MARFLHFWDAHLGLVLVPISGLVLSISAILTLILSTPDIGGMSAGILSGLVGVTLWSTFVLIDTWAEKSVRWRGWGPRAEPSPVPPLLDCGCPAPEPKPVVSVWEHLNDEV